MRRETIVALGLVCLLGTVGLAIEEEVSDGRIWFGLGGSTLGLFFPDLTAVDAFLTDNGFGGFGDAMLFSGGRGRGGALRGLSLGGIGWGSEVKSSVENRYAELAIGFGGLELGRVIGGDGRSLLTLGVVLGGGGASLTLIEDAAAFGGDDGPFRPCGIVPEPAVLGRHGAFGAVEPFVSLQVQPLHYLGFELHLGYLVPLFTFEWGDAELEGVSPGLAGPVVGFSVTWGAIGRPAIRPVFERPELEETIDQSVSLAGPCVEVDNAIGEITVETAGSPDAESTVRIVATKRARSQATLDRVSVLIEPTRCGLAVHSKGPRNGYWEIDYVLTVPTGIEIEAKQAAGDVRLYDVSSTAAVELGLGDVEVSGFAGASLAVSSGAGDVRIGDVEAETIEVGLGTGDIEIVLPNDASYEVAAEAGIGEIRIGPFLGLEAIEADGLASSVGATLGAGERSLSVKVGVGEIEIRPASE